MPISMCFPWGDSDVAFLAPLVPALTAIGSIAGIAGTAYSILKKPPKPPSQIRPVTRDDAVLAAQADDALLRRQGSLADILTGTRGLEAGAGTTGKFVVGN
jgi:hypothetical protein